jgi:NADPH-dependent glutamate synthase beta subunit-like oxidoreductase
VLMQEIGRVEAMGFTIVLNHKVTDLLAEQAAGGFDAVFVAIGSWAARLINIPARDAARSEPIPSSRSQLARMVIIAS